MKILLFEDDEGVALLTKEALEKVANHFSVDIVHRGKEGLERAKNEKYDFFILDQVMPDYTGLEVFAELKKMKNNSVLAIIVTGSGDEKIAVQALKMGIADYIVKSADMQYLSTLPLVIEKAAEQRRMFLEREELSEKLKAKNEELETRLKMLETFEKITLDREKKILELKEEIKQLQQSVKN